MVKSIYYLSQSIGKRRKDGSPFYVMNVVAVDKYGVLNGVPVFFPDADEYNKVLNMDIAPGTAVIVDTTFQGAYIGTRVDNSVKPLAFDVPNTK